MKSFNNWLQNTGCMNECMALICIDPAMHYYPSAFDLVLLPVWSGDAVSTGQTQYPPSLVLHNLCWRAQGRWREQTNNRGGKLPFGHAQSTLRVCRVCKVHMRPSSNATQQLETPHTCILTPRTETCHSTIIERKWWGGIFTNHTSLEGRGTACLLVMHMPKKRAKKRKSVCVREKGRGSHTDDIC